MFNKRKRMAKRYVKRTKIQGEDGVTISFGFSSFPTALICGFIDGLPYVGGIASLIFFFFHRTILVTDKGAYIYRDLPFHRPGEQLGHYALGETTCVRKRGKMTFSDGQVVWHAPFLNWRERQVAEAIREG